MKERGHIDIKRLVVVIVIVAPNYNLIINDPLNFTAPVIVDVDIPTTHRSPFSLVRIYLDLFLSSPELIEPTPSLPFGIFCYRFLFA